MPGRVHRSETFGQVARTWPGGHVDCIMHKNLPIIPMRNGVLFPGISLPITAARPQTLRAIEAAIRDPEHRVLVIAQRSDVDEVTPEGLYTIGTIARITSVERGLGGMRVALEGQDRGIALRVTVKDDY